MANKVSTRKYLTRAYRGRIHSVAMERKGAPHVKNVSIQVRVPKKDRDRFHKMAAEEHKDLSDIIRDFLYARLEAKKEGRAA